jgi:hypothetical protein
MLVLPLSCSDQRLAHSRNWVPLNARCACVHFHKHWSPPNHHH